MNEEEKKAIELLKQPPDFSLRYYERENAIDIVLNLIEKQQKEIEKKDAIINKMSEMLVEDKEWFYSEFDNYSKEQFKDYFTNLKEDK